MITVYTDSKISSEATREIYAKLLKFNARSNPEYFTAIKWIITNWNGTLTSYEGRFVVVYYNETLKCWKVVILLMSRQTESLHFIYGKSLLIISYQCTKQLLGVNLKYS